MQMSSPRPYRLDHEGWVQKFVEIVLLKISTRSEEPGSETLIREDEIREIGVASTGNPESLVQFQSLAIFLFLSLNMYENYLVLYSNYLLLYISLC